MCVLVLKKKLIFEKLIPLNDTASGWARRGVSL
jgi:hypothetical protein